MDNDFSILFCLTCASDVEPPELRAHQDQDHVVVKIGIVGDEAAVEGAE